MSRIWLNPAALGAATEMSVVLGRDRMLEILRRQDNGFFIVEEEDLPTIREFLLAIEDHFEARYPNWNENAPAYDESHEDEFFDALAIHKYPLAHAVLTVYGDRLPDDWAS